jgi:MSHA biogenesis protein MshI
MLFRRPSREQGQWLAVTQEGAVASAARVSTSPDGRPRLDWFWRADADTMGNALKALQRQHPLRGASLVGLVPHDRYRIVAAEAPDVPREEWSDAIRWSLREQVDFAVDDAVIDVLSLPAATQLRQSSQTLTVVMPREVQADLQLVADDHGLRWNALEVPETALRNICALGEEEGKAHALLAFGAQQALLVISFQGELIMMRHIEVMLSAITARDDSRGGALSRAALEVLRTLDTHERVHSQAPLAGLTVALPPGASDDTLEMLAELIYLPVKALNLADHLDLSAVEDAAPELARRASAHELLSIGAALRGWLAQQGRQQLQLVDPGAEGAASVPWGARMGLQLTGAALLLCVVAGGALAWMQHDAQSRLKASELKQAELQQQLAMLTVPPVVKQLEQLRQRETIQRQMRDVLKGAGAQASTGYSDYLMALGRQAQAQLWITGLLVEGDGRNLELRGRTTDPANLPPYLARLHEEERFKGRRFAQVELQAVVDETETPQGLTDFVLRGELPEGDGASRRVREEAR